MNYTSDCNTNVEDSADPTGSWIKEVIKYYTFGWDAGEALLTIFPHWTPSDYYDEYWMFHTWPGTDWPVSGDVSCHWEEYWFTDDYYFDEGDNCDDDGNGNPAPLSFPFQFANYFYEDPDWGPDGALYRESVSIGTSISFWSGGAPDSTATRFFKLHASAYDNIGHSNISGSLLSIASGQCNSEGNRYRLATDNDWYDCTVTAEGDYADFNFNVEPAKAKLAITRGGANITDQTNTVIVGEQIALTCQFLDMADQPFNIATITNFQWTVGGQTVSNYIPSTPASVLNETLNTTNSSITFYWWRPTNNVEVQCAAIAKGISMTAKAKFDVRAPTYSLSICSSNSIAVDANYHLQGASGTYLHFGDGADAPGVVFRATPGVLVQASNEFNLDMTQVINSFTAKRWSNGILQTLSMANVWDTGIDVYDLGSNVIGSADSPAELARSSFSGVSRDDSFSIYVMYQSATPGSIWVPLSVGTWSWNGTATNNGGWTLISSNFVPVGCSSGSSASGFPVWTNRFFDLITHW